jgi:hypothetical protein
VRIAGDPLADPFEPGQLLLLRRSLRLDVDMDHVARLLPLVPLHRWLGSRLRSRFSPRRRIAPALVVMGTSSSRAILRRVQR